MQIAHGESNGGDYSVLSTEYSRAGVEQFVDECVEFRFLAIDFEKQLLGHRLGLLLVPIALSAAEEAGQNPARAGQEVVAEAAR